VSKPVIAWRLMVCAAGSGVHVPNVPPVLVCGRPPGHRGPHRDAMWPVRWRDEEEEKKP